MELLIDKKLEILKKLDNDGCWQNFMALEGLSAFMLAQMLILLYKSIFLDL